MSLLEHGTLEAPMFGDVPRPAREGEVALYRFFDADGQLLYVGVSAEPFRRWASHTERHWWKKAVKFAIVWHPDEAAARAAERSAIQVEAPLHNVHGVRARQGNAIRAGVRLSAARAARSPSTPLAPVFLEPY
jgi:predicted GIY-YIG superfamily endonuclease